MDVSGVGDADTSAGRISDDAESDVESDGHDVGSNADATNNESVWRPYLPTDSDLLKLLSVILVFGYRLLDNMTMNLVSSSFFSRTTLLERLFRRQTGTQEKNRKGSTTWQCAK